MSPFKVIRCRYFELNGNAIPPYCSLGRHCTFLHPDDKGWPGGDPHALETHDNGDKSHSHSPNWPRHRFINVGDIDKPLGQSKHGSSPLRLAAAIDIPPNASNTYYAKRDTPQSSRKIPPPVPAILNIFHDIARTQIQLTRREEQIEETTKKLAAFKELSESLSKINPLSASAVKSTLDVISQTQQEIKAKYEADTRHLSDLWDDVLHIFLRAICHQFDIELQSGADFLRQEAHIIVRSLRKQAESYRQLLKSKYSDTVNDGQRQGITMEIGASGASTVDHPVGQSDTGWGCKRRRISTPDDNEIDFTSKPMEQKVTEIIAKLQQKLDAQDDKINVLVSKNESLEKILEEHRIKIDINSKYSSEKDTHDHIFNAERFSQHIGPNLHGRIMDIITPALEHHKAEMEQLNARLQSLADDFRNFQDVKHETMLV